MFTVVGLPPVDSSLPSAASDGESKLEARNLGWHQQVPKECGWGTSSTYMLQLSGEGLFGFVFPGRLKVIVLFQEGRPKGRSDPSVHGQMERWTDKQNVVYPYNGVLFSLKRGGTF